MTIADLRLPALRLPNIALPKMDVRRWAASAVLAAMLVLNLLAGLSLVSLGTPADRAVAKVAAGLPEALRNQIPPAPEPLKFREIAPEDAVAFNANIPVSTLPNPAARPFRLSVTDEADRTRALECLTSAIYYEAASESLDGQRAVAQVVLNRVRHPAYPNSVCGVVFQGSERSTGCQFTFTCDGSIARTPHAGLWAQARKIAEAALSGSVYKPVGWATHYHTNWVVPYWSSSLVKAANVGTHIFYRWTGGWGTGPAFRTRYAGSEPTVSKMRHLTSVPATVTAELEAEITEAALAGLAGEEAPLASAAAAVDLSDRPVVRRYEPVKAEAVSALIATQAKKGEPIPQSYRWAMTGDAPAKDSFGKKPEAPRKAEPAPKPAQPKELSGVRKAGQAYGPADSTM